MGTKKKGLAVLLAAAMVGSVCAMAVSAEESGEDILIGAIYRDLTQH